MPLCFASIAVSSRDLHSLYARRHGPKFFQIMLTHVSEGKGVLIPMQGRGYSYARTCTYVRAAGSIPVDPQRKISSASNKDPVVRQSLEVGNSCIFKD